MPPAVVVLGILGFFAIATATAVALSSYYGLEANPTVLRIRSQSGRNVEVPWHAIEAVKVMSIGLLATLARAVFRCQKAGVPTALAFRPRLVPCSRGGMGRRRERPSTVAHRSSACRPVDIDLGDATLGFVRRH